MKTKIEISAQAVAKLDTFVPQEGSWWNENHDSSEAEADIAADLSGRVGFPVKVECFHANGHAITSDCAGGSFLATRKG